jgi:hypothetical protein
MRERPLSNVPNSALFLLALALCLQIALHFNQPVRQPTARDLPQAPSSPALRLASFGEPVALAKVLMLYLQAFDSQPGIHMRYRQLDYAHVKQWLVRMLELDPKGQYPLFAASQIYGVVKDEDRQRLMFDFVYQQFFIDPNHRWPWLARAAVVAKHGLKDLPLARKYAQAIRLHATGSAVPSWAKQMEIFILEDMDELQSAKILIGGLINNGQISDPHELRFLKERLDQMEHKANTR